MSDPEGFSLMNRVLEDAFDFVLTKSKDKPWELLVRWSEPANPAAYELNDHYTGETLELCLLRAHARVAAGVTP